MDPLRKHPAVSPSSDRPTSRAVPASRPAIHPSTVRPTAPRPVLRPVRSEPPVARGPIPAPFKGPTAKAPKGHEDAAEEALEVVESTDLDETAVGPQPVAVPVVGDRASEHGDDPDTHAPAPTASRRSAPPPLPLRRSVSPAAMSPTVAPPAPVPQVAVPPAVVPPFAAQAVAAFPFAASPMMASPPAPSAAPSFDERKALVESAERAIVQLRWVLKELERVTLVAPTKTSELVFAAWDGAARRRKVAIAVTFSVALCVGTLLTALACGQR